MVTSKGVLQGYYGVAAIDAAHQITVDARAHGTGCEQELLMPVVIAVQAMRTSDTFITADAGYHSEANLQKLATRGVPALIADNEMRRRDERVATQHRYTVLPNPLHDKSKPAFSSSAIYTPTDFRYDADTRTCPCPAGKSLCRARNTARRRAKGAVRPHFAREIIERLCTEPFGVQVRPKTTNSTASTALRSAAAHQTKCGRTGGVRQHGDRLPRTAWRCQQQRFVRGLPVRYTGPPTVAPSALRCPAIRTPAADAYRPIR